MVRRRPRPAASSSESRLRASASSTFRPRAQPTPGPLRRRRRSGPRSVNSFERRSLSLAPSVERCMIGLMDAPEDEDEDLVDTDKRLSLVDEALVAGTIANTNGLLVILAKLVAKGVFDRADLQSFSDSYS